MYKTIRISSCATVVVTALALAGCGNSYPLPPTSAQTSAATPAAPSTVVAPTPTASTPAAYVIAAGAFRTIGPAASAAVDTGNCNLDDIDGRQVASGPLSRDGSVLLGGWAASLDDTSAPASVQIILQGARDYALQVRTGAQRDDVAAARGQAALARSGYVIKASLAEVPAGTYDVELRYDVAGKPLRCRTTQRLTVR